MSVAAQSSVAIGMLVLLTACGNPEGAAGSPADSSDATPRQAGPAIEATVDAAPSSSPPAAPAESARSVETFCNVILDGFWEAIPDSASPAEVAEKMTELVRVAPLEVRGELLAMQQSIQPLESKDEVRALYEPGTRFAAASRRYEKFVDHECYGEPIRTPGQTRQEDELDFLVAVRRDEMLNKMSDADLIDLGNQMCALDDDQVGNLVSRAARKNPEMMMSFIYLTTATDDFLCPD